MFSLKTGDQAALEISSQFGAEAPSWLSFPVHGRILASGDIVLLEHMEKTYKRLVAASKSGTASERKRAYAGQRAYELTRKLIETILETRKQLIRR